ncbi:MAG: GNAT family N-acetyltransferase [Sphingobacteriaceae bacterium]
MIKFIRATDTLSIRNEVLREGKLVPEACRFETDDLPRAFHLGYFGDDQLLSIASFHPQELEGFPGNGCQLRGMATVPVCRGKGLGAQLLNFAIVYLKGQKVNYLWCNARKNAWRFYQSIGFEKVTDEFEVAGIGPHYRSYLKIQS